MKRNKLAYFLVAFFLISLILLLFPGKFLLADYRVLKTNVIVGDYVGINVNSDALYFGTVFKGGYSEREFSIDNFECRKCKVVIKADGDTKDWIWVSNRSFTLKEGESIDLKAIVDIPRDAEFGNYTGNLKIYFWKVI